MLLQKKWTLVSVKKKLVSLKSEKKLLDKEVYGFRMEVTSFFSAVVKKHLTKSPIVYKLVGCLEWMIPDVFVDSKDKCLSQINEVLKALSDKNQIADSECDDIINQSKLFREEVLNSDRSTEFSSFTITDEQ